MKIFSSPTPDNTTLATDEALNSLFHSSKHVGLRSSAANQNWEGPSPAPTVESHFPERQAPKSTVPRSPSSASPTFVWTDLPPCPINGYRLTERGLVDLDVALEAAGGKEGGWRIFPWKRTLPEPPVLSPTELRELITDLQVMEQEAKQKLDDELPRQFHWRTVDGFDHVLRHVLLLSGIYLMTLRTVRAYRSAVPRNSILLNGFFTSFRPRLSVRMKEEMARRHCRVMQATTRGVLYPFWGGLIMTSLTWGTWPETMDVTATIKAVQGRHVSSYYQHTNKALQWMWTVYVHHPAYAKHSSRERGSLMIA